MKYVFPGLRSRFRRTDRSTIAIGFCWRGTGSHDRKVLTRLWGPGGAAASSALERGNIRRTAVWDGSRPPSLGKGQHPQVYPSPTPSRFQPHFKVCFAEGLSSYTWVYSVIYDSRSVPPRTEHLLSSWDLTNPESIIEQPNCTHASLLPTSFYFGIFVGRNLF